MMRKIQLTQVSKAALQFGVVTGLTIDSWLLVANTTGIIDTPISWYFLGPLAVWSIVGIPASISSTEKLFDTLHKRPGRITRVDSALAVAGRSIPYHHGGKTDTIFASLQRWAVGTDQESIRESQKRIASSWIVPTDSEQVTITEPELTRFLQLAQRRKSHQFSRNYWCKKRRPPMPRPYYEATMRLLAESGLVAGRQFGASGYLPPGVKIHNAITHLKHESQFRL